MDTGPIRTRFLPYPKRHQKSMGEGYPPISARGAWRALGGTSTGIAVCRTRTIAARMETTRPTNSQERLVVDGCVVCGLSGRAALEATDRRANRSIFHCTLTRLLTIHLFR